MLDEYRIEQMGVGAYVDSIDEEVITVDQAVQRAFCWSNEMINNLIYSTVSPKRIYIPNIILAEEKREDGLTTTYVVDGGQRTEALRRFVFDGHKISKSIRNRYVTYQGNKLDKNGKPMRDENGKLIKEILRAMDKGFYEGVNLAMCYCEDCGYQQVEMDTCPKCGSKMITKIDRMNGYLGFTRVHGQTRYNEAKNAEIKDRVSM